MTAPTPQEPTRGERIATAAISSAYFDEAGTVEAGKATGSRRLVRVVRYPKGATGALSTLRRGLYRMQFRSVRNRLLLLAVVTGAVAALAHLRLSGVADLPDLAAQVVVWLAGAVAVAAVLLLVVGHVAGARCADREDARVSHHDPEKLWELLAPVHTRAVHSSVWERLDGENGSTETKTGRNQR